MKLRSIYFINVNILFKFIANIVSVLVALLKKECVYLHTFIDYNHAKLVLFQYIEGFYNRKRIHSSINYMTPDKFEQICRVA